MRYVERVRLENIRGFELLELELADPVTVLVGVNGSGKSTVLQALAGNLSGGSGFGAEQLRHGAVDGAVEVDEQRLRVFASGTSMSDDLWSRRAPKVMGVLYGVGREAPDATPRAPRAPGEGSWAIEGLWGARTSFEHLYEWFYYMETLENEHRARLDRDHRDSQLSAVRDAMERLLPGFSDPWVERGRPGVGSGVPRFTIAKGDLRFAIDELSDGERATIAVVGDIARRLALTNPSAAAPLDGPGLVLIDEIELHLHPAWQRTIVPRLVATFPNVQFVVTTHSPQVLSQVETSAVRVLQDFAAYTSPPTRGRDSNQLLMTVFETDERDPDVKAELQDISRLIDEEAYADARDALAALAKRIGDDEPEITRSRAMLAFLRAG